MRTARKIASFAEIETESEALAVVGMRECECILWKLVSPADMTLSRTLPVNESIRSVMILQT